MRLCELGLLAFGPFDGQVLHFGQERRLHLVYGPNEAGKSTALRAIGGLLYGIPPATSDAHVHPMPKLRLAGTLLSDAGEVLRVVRRKGRKATLRDPDDEPIDEAVLERMLGGVREPLFRSLFGLDHVSLGEGARAMLAGGGDVGESLFDAGGARGVHQVLAELRAEADELYRPRGRKQKLNEALFELREARGAVTLATTGGEAYQAQREALERAQAEHEQLVGERRELYAERSRLQRVRRVLPLLATLAELTARRDALPHAPALERGARERRLAAQRELAVAGREVERLELDVASLDERARDREGHGSIGELAEADLDHVQDMLGRHRAATKDLPRRLAELGALGKEVEVAAAGIGRTLDEVRQGGLERSAEARIQELAKQHGGLCERLSLSAEAEAEHARKLTAARRELGELPPARDVARLRALVSAAERAGDVDGLLREGAAEVERRRDGLRRRAARLGYTSDLDLALPSVEATRLADQQHAATERQLEELAADRRRVTDRGEALRASIEAIVIAGDVATEAQLDRERGRRDELFARLAEKWTPGVADEYRGLVREADALADRRYREADRVARHASLVAEALAVERQLALCDERRQELERHLEAAAAAYRHDWQRVGIDPGPPRAMLAWLADHHELCAEQDAVRGLEAELAARSEERRRLLDGLAVEVGSACPADGDLAEALSRARAMLGEHERVELRRRTLEELCAELQRDEASAQVRRSRAEGQLADWSRQWREAMAGGGMAEGTSVEAALALAGEMRALQGKLVDMRRLERRVAGMQRDSDELAAEVRRLCAAHAPDLTERDVAQAADELIRRHRAALHDREEARRIRQDLDERRRELADAEARRAGAQRELRDLMQAAGASTVEALEQVEGLAEQAVALALRVEEAEAMVLSEGEGATLAELCGLSRGVDADQVKARLGDIEQSYDEIDARLVALRREIVDHQYTLETHFEQRSGAFAEAARVQQCLARVHRFGERYLRSYLAVRLLEQQIERYRQEHEGPVLARARQLFARLTLGALVDLKVDYRAGDEAELLCVRASGEELGVAGLSDGTRDQLYLALRLATIERFARRGETVPLVLDDILVHFDDERAAAALEVLGEVTQLTQVLFFTHHDRLRHIARESVPAERFQEHVLCPRDQRNAGA